jgi:hypothetical protein
MITDKEIKELFAFVAHKRVRYKDVQIELVDHLATAIEENMLKDTSLTFSQALDNVYGSFGIFGFAKIVEQKERSMMQFWRRRIFSYVKRFYALPRIIGTLGSMVLLFLLLQHQIISVKFIMIITTLCAFLGIVWVMYKNHTLDNIIRDYLYVKSYYSVIGGLVFGFFYMPQLWINDFDKTIWAENIWALMGIGIFFPMAIILSYICLYEIPIELKNEFEKRFKRYILT